MNSLKRYTKTLFCSVGFLATALLAGCGGGGDQGRDPILGLPAASLVSVAVTPATATVAGGGTQQFVAVATYADGASRDVTTSSSWTSATPAVATVNATSGVATGLSVGTASISAAFGGKSGAAVLTVTPATLVSLAIVPVAPSIAVGATQQFAAVGTFSDNTTRDITAATTFASASPLVATVGATSGLATGLTVGTSVISATSGIRSGSTTLTVTPAVLTAIAITPVNPTVQIGASRQLAVVATYSDNTTVDVSSLTAYSSATPAAATVGATSGMTTGVAAGTSLITAGFGGKTASTLVTVPAATLASIAVTPASATVGVAGIQQFIATATYSDNSTADISNSAIWTSGNNLIATVLPTGVATGISAGVATITATAAGKTGSGNLTVSLAAPAPVPAPGVNLGSAATFAVLAGTSITNNSGGTTLITGNVGSGSQTTPPTVAPGFTNYTSGAILTNALADLQVAANDANSRTCTTSSAAGIDLGGRTFTPGVYCYAGSISVTGTLNLNGPGVYIFRTTTTLNTTANSIVALLNGATADNVFWVPVGPTTLGANSVFKGSILGKAAAITVGDNTTLLNGRVLSGAAVTLKNNQITK